jgi:DNA-binding MurR/RpiR family transcriptional regulator
MKPVIDQSNPVTRSDGDGPQEDRSRERLIELFAGTRLTPVQRRLAAYITDHGREAAFASSVRLAEIVGVSQPSVTRLASSMGFSGYGELQLRIREIVVSPNGPASFDPSRSLNKMQHAVQSSIEALTLLSQQLSDTRDVDHAAAVLVESSPLIIYGTRASAALANHFFYFADKIHPAVSLVAGGASEATERITRSQLSGATCMLAIVLPRYPREAQRVLRFARERGLKIVLVTDSVLSPLVAEEDIVLPAPVNSELIFDAAVGPAQMLTVLLEGLADSASARSQSRLESLETLAVAERFFLDDR